MNLRNLTAHLITLLRIIPLGVAAALWVSEPALAAISQSPLFLTNRADPLVMLTMSNDHQLYYKAYDDYSDLDNDGVPETSYKHSVDYYGYFDSNKCYTYDTTDKRFEPAAVTADKYCTSGAGQWSGNFLNWASMARIDTIRKILYGGNRSTDTSTLTVLERTFLPNDAHSWAKYYDNAAGDISKLTPFSVALTVCNTTLSSSSTAYSQNVTDPPLLRVATGDYALWAGNERWQCRWSGEKSASNGNVSASSGLNSATSNPDKTTNGLGEKDYVVRVEVCNSSLIGNEECKRYPDGNYKPVGLLQKHGDDGYMNFGLLTGSYSKNKEGGVLRKSVSPFTDEVNVDSDGTFTGLTGAGTIVDTIDKLRIFGYYFSDGTYNDTSNSGDDCSWGINGFVNGKCTNWGNPQSEILLETYRYFSGQTTAYPSFKVIGDDKISGLTSLNSWTDPLSNDNYCAPLNIINFNASSSSYEGNIFGVDAVTSAIGVAEGITGKKFFVGETTSDTDGLCTAKTVSSLSEVYGTCPDAPRLRGNYDIAGLAYSMRTTDLRPSLQGTQNVYTYGVALSPNVPQLEIPKPDGSGGVVILPACHNSSINTPDAGGGNCAIVDFKVVKQYYVDVDGKGKGKVYVNWEDSEQGGDYDQDMWGTLTYEISNTEITVTTDVIAESTPYAMGFGYTIGGTTQDGFHAHSGIEGFSYSDPTGATACSGCNVGDSATSATYTLGSSDAELLQQPLYYAAKWGGFKENSSDANNQLDKATEWDSNSDGIPDSYFYATNPGELSNSLSKAFSSVVSTKSSSASIVADSVTLETGTHIYQAHFNSGDWTGDIQAFPLNLQGEVGDPDWSAQAQLDSKAHTSRVILTTKPGVGGVEFQWANLTATQQALLNTDPVSGAADTYGDKRLAYVRGDNSYELQEGLTPKFRDRTHKLGDIVSSTPYYVGAPSFYYPDHFIDYNDTDSYYSAFMADIAALNSDTGRTPMLYSGANDGMLHGFSAKTGEELIAYVPNAVYANLPKLTDINYAHQYFVDGSPTAGDAYDAFPGCTDSALTVEASPLTPCWRTVLVGGMNAGAKGIYALDVTNPDDFAVANASHLVLWEIDSTTTGFSELGYTFGQPAIARMANGDWAVIVSNGYGSTSGAAILYIIDLATGSLIRALDTGVTGGNGLSTAAPVDTDGNGIVEYIYAGDLKGNLWKFDVRSTNPGQWKSAFNQGSTPKPLYIAKNASDILQPITAAPEIGQHPTGTGFMVFFGTGKYFEDGDNDPSSTPMQTFYGIWDKANGTYGKTRSDLLQQTIDVEQTMTFGGHTYDIRVTSDHPVTWDDGDASTSPNHFGWYMDLKLDAGGTGTAVPGERVIHPAFLRYGRIVFITLIPSQHACDYGGTGWLMELDSTNGGRLDVSPFDLNHDGAFDSQEYVTIDDGNGGTIDVPVSGKKSQVGIIQKPTVISAGKKEYKYSSGSKDAEIEMTTESTDAGGKGRASWRQLR